MPLRVMIDPNLAPSALLAPTGLERRVMVAVGAGAIVPVVSPLLLGELEDLLARPKFHYRITPEEAQDLRDLFAALGQLYPDPLPAEWLSRDRDDEYLIRLYRVAKADRLVTDDRILSADAAALPDVQVRRSRELVEELSGPPP